MRRLLIPLLAAVAVLGAGCADWRDEDAATVDGEAISMSALRDEVDVLVAHPDLASAFQVDVAAGDVAGQQSTTLVAWLNRRIADLAIEEELARRGVAVDASARSRAEAGLRFQLGLYGQRATDAGQGGAPLEQFEALPADLRAGLIEREAARETLAAAVAAEGDEPLPLTAEEWFEANEDDYQRHCVSIIVSRDEATSEGLLRRIRAGEDFAALATTESIDPASAARGGDADCALASQLSPELASQLGAADVGEVVGPIQLADGWFLIQLTSSGLSTFDEAQQEVEVDRLNARQTALNEWLSEASPQVTVAPRLGTWDAEAFRVAPNRGPQQAGARPTTTTTGRP